MRQGSDVFQKLDEPVRLPREPFDLGEKLGPNARGSVASRKREQNVREALDVSEKHRRRKLVSLA